MGRHTVGIMVRLLLLLIVFSASVQSETVDETVDEHLDFFQSVDTNKDGKIVLAEMKQWLKNQPNTMQSSYNNLDARQLFEEFDTNRDRKITPAELTLQDPDNVSGDEDEDADLYADVEVRDSLLEE